MANISSVQVGSNQYGLRSTAILTGSIDSSSTSSALIATVSKITELTNGIYCSISNNQINASSGATLNVNSLGAKPIYDSTTNATIQGGIYNKDSSSLFSYSETMITGGCWIIYPNGSSGELIATIDANGLLTIQNAIYIENGDLTAY